MYYRCLDCGHIFEEGEENTYKQRLGNYGNDTVLEELKVCPKCGGDYEEAKRCAICDEYAHLYFGKKYCYSCGKQVRERLTNFVDENFSDEERDCLNIIFDGEWI